MKPAKPVHITEHVLVRYLERQSDAVCNQNPRPVAGQRPAATMSWHHQAKRQAKARAARRTIALSRAELDDRYRDTFARRVSDGPTSPAVKVRDPETQKLIDEYIERQAAG